MNRNFRISDWSIQPQINCITRGDHSVHLEPKVMQVLVQLAAHPGEVLSKDSLIHAVWPDTFVGDEVLTRCISEIRRVLEDDARAPRFVQTIPKVGYRLIAPVEFEEEKIAPAVPPAGSRAVHQAEASATVITVAAPAPPAAEPAVHAPPPTKSPNATRRSVLVVASILAVTLVVAVAGWLFVEKGWLSQRQRPTYKTVPFTSYSGSQSQPTFSPDGNKIAFVWNGESGGHQNIYVKMIGTEMPIRLTADAADDFSPAWSPDGRFIAFLRTSDTDRGVYIMPSIGGPPRKVFSPRGSIDWSRGALTWSPDGKRLVFPDGKSSQSPSALYSLDVATSALTQITTPEPSWDGDFSPAFSPDGSKIAFIRGVEGAVRDVYVMNANGSGLTRLTNDNRLTSSLTWTADGANVIFSSDRGGKFSLWSVPAKGGEPARLPVGTEDATNPAVASKGDRLAYGQGSAKWSIMRVNLQPAAGKKVFSRLLSSTEQDSAPRFSPDGTHIAFQSWRSGTQEIWICANDGSNPTRLTSFNGAITGSPSWSPDGRRIVFDSRPEGRSHIYTMPIDGGVPKAITSGNYNDILPNWSRDTQSVYFGSNRSGTWQIWKVPILGGEPRQITKQGGFVGAETFDGKWLYYARADSAGLWRVPVEGGAEEQVLDQPISGYWGYWSMAKDGIYFLDIADSVATIKLFDPQTGRSTRVHTLEQLPPVFSGLSVAPDHNSLVYTDVTEVGSHITLVEDFR